MKIIKFYKNGCVPCNTVQQFLESNGVTEVQSVNIFDDPDTAFDYGIMSVPVTILIDDGNSEVSRVIGFNSDGLKSLIDTYKESKQG